MVALSGKHLEVGPLRNRRQEIARRCWQHPGGGHCRVFKSDTQLDADVRSVLEQRTDGLAQRRVAVERMAK